MNKEVKIQLYKENNKGLDGYLTLTKESNLPFTIGIGDIKDISKRTSTFSKSITIAGTQENNILLGHYYDLNISNSTFDVDKIQKVRVIIDGEILYDNCSMQLIEITKKQLNSMTDEYIEYIVQIKSEESSFFNNIKNKELTDIKFTVKDIPNNGDGIAFKYTPTFIEDSYNNTFTDGYKFLIQNTIYNATEQIDKIGMNNFKPSIYVWQYWNKIISDAGYRYTFDEIGVQNSVLVNPSNDGINMRKLLIPYTDKVGEDTFKDEFFYKATVTSDNTYSPYTITDNFVASEILLNDVIEDTSLSYNISTRKYIPQFTGFIKIDTKTIYETVIENLNSYQLEAIQTNPLLQFKFRLKNILLKNGVIMDSVNVGNSGLVNGQVFNIGNNVIDTETVDTILRCNVNPLDEIEVRTLLEIDAQSQALFYLADIGTTNMNTNWIPKFLVSKQTIFITTTVANGGLNYGSIIDMNDYIPKKIKQSDFFKSILNMFNIYVVVDKLDPNLLYFYTRDTFYDNGTTKNWNDKKAKDRNQTIKLVSEVTNKEKYFTYKQDKDINNVGYFDEYSETYGSARFIFDNEFVTDEDKVEIIFSPSPILKDRDRHYTDLSTESLRILYDGGQKTSTQYKIVGWNNTNSLTTIFYPLTTHLDDIVNPQNDINFGTNRAYMFEDYRITSNNLFNKYWRRTLHQINTSKIYTVYLHLTENDIRNLNLNDNIYLDGSYWYINTIIDYNPVKTNITKVELISVDDLLKTGKPVIVNISNTGILTPVIQLPTPESNGNTYSGGIKNGGKIIDTSTIGFNNIVGENTTTVGDNITNTGVGGIAIGNDIHTTKAGLIIGNNVTNMGEGGVIIGDNVTVDEGVRNVLVLSDNVNASQSDTLYVENISVINEADFSNGIVTSSVETDDLFINDLTGGVSINNLGIDANGKVVVGTTGGVSSNVIYDTYTNILTMKTNSTLQPGKFYYMTDRDIMLTAVKNNDFALTVSRVFNIIKDSYYTPSTSTFLGITNYYGGIYGQTITQGSYPVGTFLDVRYVIWGGQMWRRDNSGVDVPGPSDSTIQSGWAVIPRTDLTFYEPKVFNIKYDFETDYIFEQSDDRGNVIRPLLSNSLDYINKTDWGNTLIKDNTSVCILNNYNDLLPANITSNIIYGEISNNKRGSIYYNLVYGSISDNIVDDIGYNINTRNIINNSALEIMNNRGMYDISENIARNISGNHIDGDITHNNMGALGDILSNSNKGHIFNNRRSANNIYITHNANNGGIYRNIGDNIRIEKNINNGNIGSQISDTTRVSNVFDTPNDK